MNVSAHFSINRIMKRWSRIGLGLYNIKFRAMAELIRSFLETSINKTFINNQYHLALYLWNIENLRNLPEPETNPFLSVEMFNNIKQVKEEGLLNISKLSSGGWYKALLENNITMATSDKGIRTLKPCKAELVHPEIDWEATWKLAVLPGLSSEDQTFLWRMLHNLLPTQERLNRMKLPNAPTPNCNQCDSTASDQLHHALVTCPQNKDVADWLLLHLQRHVPALNPKQLVLLDFGHLKEELELPFVWLVSQVLGSIWKSRKEKRKPQLHQTRAKLEAGIAIMRKTRLHNFSTILDSIIIN